MIRLRVESGSTFDGFIREFDGVRIDNFSNLDQNVQLYLLSHLHSDHLKGLKAKNFQCSCKIICSQLTLDILKKTTNIPKSNYRYFKLMPEDLPFTVQIGDQLIRVTLIPSYHCPGSVMFLLESETVSVLYTGDLRAESWWVHSLVQNPFLSPYLHKCKMLDNVYLDTTFGYRSEPYIEMLSNSEGISLLTEIIKLYPLEDLKFHFMETTSGFEELWVKLASVFDSHLYVEPNIRTRLGILQNAQLPYMNFLQNRLSTEKVRFNVCKRPDDDDHRTFNVNIRSIIDCSLAEYKCKFSPISIEDVKEEDLTQIGATSLGHKVYQYQDSLWLCYHGKLLPRDLKVPFSRHSSYSECVDFIFNLNPKQVYGCVDSRLSWELGFNMSRVFGEYCQGSNFLFDFEREAIYGKVNHSSEIKVVNRWSESYNMLDLPVREPSFDFKGQYYVSAFSKKLDNDDIECIEQSRKLAHLNKIYIGRNIDKCNKLILQNKFKIKPKRDYSIGAKLLKKMDTYESSTDFSEETGSFSRYRELLKDDNFFQKRLVISDLEKGASEEDLVKPKLDQDSFIEHRLTDYDLFEIFPPDNFTHGSNCALDESGIGWFQIKLSCLK